MVEVKEREVGTVVDLEVEVMEGRRDTEEEREEAGVEEKEEAGMVEAWVVKMEVDKGARLVVDLVKGEGEAALVVNWAEARMEVRVEENKATR